MSPLLTRGARGRASTTTRHVTRVTISVNDQSGENHLGDITLTVTFDVRWGEGESGYPHNGTYDPGCGDEVSFVSVDSDDVRPPAAERLAHAWLQANEDAAVAAAMDDRDDVF